MRGLFILFCGFLPLMVFAQQKVVLWGKVCDANGMPIPQANVVVGLLKGIATDNEGNYSISAPLGTYDVLITSVGFARYRKTIDIKESLQLNVVLQIDSVHLASVEVVAIGKNQVLREKAYSTNVLDIKSLTSSQNNLVQIIGRSNGINIRQEGGVGSDFDLSINGLSGNSVRYFIDGIPIAAWGSGVNIANFPLNLIDRVEVFKGVVPANFGADALGGAVNVVTNKKNSNYLDLSYGYGAFNTHKADLNAQITLPKTGLMLRPSVGFNHSDNNYTMHGVEVWNAVDKEFQNKSVKRFHDAYTSVLGRLQVGVADKKWADAFFVAATLSDVEKQLQTGSTQSVVYGQAQSNSQSTALGVVYRKQNFLANNLTVDAAYTHTWDQWEVVDTTYRKYRWDGTYIVSSRNEITGRAKSLRHINRPLDVADVGFVFLWMQKHALTLHYSLNSVLNKRTDLVDTTFVPSNDSFDKHITGLSYNLDWMGNRIGNMLFVKNYTSHLEIEQQDLYWITGSNMVAKSSTTSNWGWGGGARFKMNEAFLVKTSYEYAIRLPLAKELLGNGTTIYPNFTLHPEHSNNLNLGVMGSVGLTNGQRLGYEANLFVRKVENYIRLQVSQSDGMSQYNNVSNVSVQGIESEWRYNYGRKFDVTANVSYINEINKTRYQANGKPEITYNNRVPNKPWLYANLMANYRINEPWGVHDSRLTLGYDLRYVHWFFLTWEGYGALKSKAAIPNQLVSNSVVSYSLQNDRYNVSLACDNLFDRTVYDNYKLQKPGRFVFLKFRYFINSL